jgi:hypothetical protein
MAGFSRVAAALSVPCAVALLVGGCTPLKQFGAGVHNTSGKARAFAANVRVVSVDTAGDITVTGGGAGDAVVVTEQPSYSKTPPVTTRRVTGATLTLAYTCKTQLVCSVNYTIQVPRGVAVHAVSREGSITLTSVSGAVTAQTITGLVTATGLTSPSAVLKSGAGGIDATFAAAPASVSASTDAGTITIAVPGTASYKVNAHAVIGVTTDTVHHVASSPHVITAHSDLGSITISPS